MNIPTSRLPLEDGDTEAYAEDNLAILVVFLAIGLSGALIGALIMGLVWWLT